MKPSGMTALFAAMMGATFAAVSSASPDVLGSVTEHDPTVLPKTIFSSKLRVVLAVGLEGTGHNYFLQVDDDLFANNPDLVRLTGHDALNMGIYHIQYSMADNVQRYVTTIDMARAQMRKLVQRSADLPAPGTVLYLHGKFSYPDGMGLNKALMYLDLRMLAEMAEEEGVDFRVVYLRRPAKDILVANTVHRGFQSRLGHTDVIDREKAFMEYMQVLITDIAVMHSFLSEIDPGFVVCHDFVRAGEVEQSASIANFLSPNSDVAERLKKSIIDVATVHGPSTEEVQYEGADKVTARLQQKFDSFESALCPSTR